MQDTPDHCPVCYSSTWSLNSGVLICETCGTQSQVSHRCYMWCEHGQLLAVHNRAKRVCAAPGVRRRNTGVPGGH